MRTHNIYSREDLKKQIEIENEQRVTLSFYKYTRLSKLGDLRDEIYKNLAELNVFGRIYLASEGINAQISVPGSKYDVLKSKLIKYKWLNGINLNNAVEENISFLKLKIKIREKIVADGLSKKEIDLRKKGKYLSPTEFNSMLGKQDTIVIDVRNHYESEVGHFEEAICPDVDTFRESLPVIQGILEKQKDKNVLLYCTGGIRCEKASAYLRGRGYNNISQLKGGIISYVHEMRKKGVASKFKGKNFVFDERLGERVTEDIISECHQCGSLSDTHTNCENDECHLLFIQCENCKEKFDGCCCAKCQEIAEMPLSQQKLRRSIERNKTSTHFNKSRLRPTLNR